MLDCFKGSPRHDNGTKTNRPIDNKILILGAGDSGKSTMFKQVKFILKPGFPTPHERSSVYKDIVIDNIIKSARNLARELKRFNIPLEDETNTKSLDFLSNLDSSVDSAGLWNQDLAKDIKNLWADGGIKKVFEQKTQFQPENIMDDSAQYFLDEVERIGAPDWVPNDRDVLMSRRKTTGIIEDQFDMGGVPVRFMDVGGQRNERKKWIHCFEGVSAIIFVVSLSEYDQKCYEDDSMNRMDESLVLFDEICNSKWFPDTPFILLFNKTDLFKEKIKKTDLNILFKNYTGGLDYTNATKFITDKFLAKNGTEKVIFPHYSCATDKPSMEEFVKGIKDVLVKGKTSPKD